ncbi:MAG TPA: argininosuccinate lyase, partial [Rhizomicrobium sp.]|nr:argininosuccinate lyase [Rhizomicrobium sp.]
MVANKMWGGRFEGGPASIMEVITPSIDFDKRMAAQDIAGSRAHARMLALQQIIGHTDCEAILKGLDTIEAEIADGTFVFSRK